MPKVLIIDTDRSLSSLASDERIEQVFGYKPRRFLNSKSVENFRDNMFERFVETTEDELGPIENEYWRLRTGRDVNYIVWDSLTSFQGIKRDELKSESSSGKLRIQDYGDLADSLEGLVTVFERSDIPFVAICHTKQTDDGSGISKYVPSLQGRMKEELFRHFDIVAYSLVQSDDAGNRSFVWQILADEYRDAKCRFEEVTKWAASKHGYIPQDFGLLTAKIKDAGYTKFNMLIIGPSGTGKTYSLRTLKNANI